MKVLFLFLFFSLSLAQSFTGTFIAKDATSGASFTLKLLENPDQTITGNFIFDTIPVMVSGKVIATGQADATLLDEAGGFAFTLTLVEPQMTLKASDTGDEILLTRESSEAPTLVQIEVSTQAIEGNTDEDLGEDISEEDFSNDPKFQECMTVLEDENSDQQKLQECQTYINSIMSQSTIEEGTGGEDEFDPEELAYCQEFLADADAVAEDPDETSYCQSYVATFGNQSSPTQPVTPDTSEGASNPLGPTNTMFSGTFRGEDIALTLQGEGNYTGILEFQGKSYPVQASSQENLLKGTFNVNGTDFEFTALLEDITLTLDSGNKTYPMLKDPASQ